MSLDRKHGGQNMTRPPRAAPAQPPGEALSRWPWDVNPFRRLTTAAIRKHLVAELHGQLGRETDDPEFAYLVDELAALHKHRMLCKRTIQAAEAEGAPTNKHALALGGEDAEVALRQTNVLIRNATKDVHEWISRHKTPAKPAPATARFRVIK